MKTKTETAIGTVPADSFAGVKDWATSIEFAITYRKGGYGGLDWKFSPRGCYLKVTPVRHYKLDDGKGGNIAMRESRLGFGPHSGGIVLLEACDRLAPKRLATIAAFASKHLDSIAEAFRDGNPDAMRHAAYPGTPAI